MRINIETTKRWFFSEILPVYIGYSKTRTEHVYDNVASLKFDNFFECQNVISDNTPPPNIIMTHAYENRYVTHLLRIWYMFEFTCFRSSHKKMFYETDALR